MAKTNMISNNDSDKMSILVVDDTPDNLRLLSSLLTESGYKVYKALRGEMALTACKNSLPDLILLDIMMPEMDGYQVCQCLKANEETRDIPIIFLSALNEAFDKVKAFEVGAVDYISKPFQDAEVLSRVQNHIRLRQFQKFLRSNNADLEREIERRKKIQKKLELSEAKNQAIINAIPDVIFRINAEGVFLDYRSQDKNASDLVEQKSSRETVANHGTNLGEKLEIFSPRGLPNPEQNLVGKSIYDVLSPDLAIWIMHYVNQTLATSELQIAEYIQRDHSQEKWQSYEIRYVKSGESEVLAIARDISSRKQAEAARLQAEAVARYQTQQIEQALSQLKTAQVQLIQNEKMVGLGQLVAGISHEINNPVNFIYGNVHHVSSALQDLLNIIDAYQEDFPVTERIAELLEAVDFKFLKKDLLKMLDSILAGAERINKIVVSLKTFARLDASGLKTVDLQEDINNALFLLNFRLKKEGGTAEIEVVKDYQNIPLVQCYPSQLNQVFLNLLNNAIDSLRARMKSEGNRMDSSEWSPWIRISTERTDRQTVLIRIKDNGTGISQSDRSRLFDPFFTTKPVGSGTGLGLSISYQIVVQQHKGALTCRSELGQGAEFAIELPLFQDLPPHSG